MNTNEIYIKNGTQYKEMTKELLTQCNLAAQIFDTDMQIGISCGIYEYMGETMDAQEIFARADKALYRAKQTGRNKCVCHSQAITAGGNTND